MATIGLPSELKPELDYSLPNGMSAYQVRVVPSNLSQIESSTQTLPATAVATRLLNTSANVIFEIPTQAGSNTVIDPRYTSLSFRAKYSCVSAGSAQNITNMCLSSHASAYFTRAFTQAGGVILEDIANYDVISDFIVQQEVDVAQRDALATCYGFMAEDQNASSQNNAQGHRINGFDATNGIAASDKYYSYSIPLLNSIIGKGASKMFNISKVNKMQIVLTTAPQLPLTIVSGGATTAGTFKVTLDNFQLNLQYVNLGTEASRLLGRSGPMFYNAVTWRSSTSTIPSGVSGAQTNLVGVRGTSVRSLFVRASEVSVASIGTANCVNSQFDSKCPTATSIAWNIGGLSYPSNPVNLLQNPALGFLQTIQAYNSFTPYEFRSSVTPSRYYVYLPSSTSLPTDSDQVFTVAGNATSATAQAMWAWGSSLETIAKAGILDGQNLNASSTFLNMTLATAPTNAVTLYFLARMDAIYVVDESGQVTVRL
jgi:hypothetical protein